MLEGLIGEMENPVFLPHDPENGGGTLEGPVRQWLKRFPGQSVGHAGAGKMEEVSQVVIFSPWEEILVLQGEVILEEGDEGIGSLKVIEETGGKSRLPLPQALLDTLDQVSLELVLQIKLRISGELHCIRGSDFVLGKEITHGESDHVIDEENVEPSPRDHLEPWQGRGGELHKTIGGPLPGQRHLTPGPEFCDQVDLTLSQEGRLPAFGKDDGIQVPSDLLPEGLADVVLLIRGKAPVVEKEDALFLQLREHFSPQDIPEVLLLEVNGTMDFPQQPGGAKAQLLPLLLLEAKKASERGDSDPEELVQIGGEDGQEGQSIQKRYSRVLCLLEDSSIEGKPGDLSIDEGGWVFW
jgi:hypothetical protein